jgi:hypothetical protein
LALAEQKLNIIREDGPLLLVPRKLSVLRLRPSVQGRIRRISTRHFVAYFPQRCMLTSRLKLLYSFQ